MPLKRFLALLVLTAMGLRAEVQFSGFFVTSEESLFTLTDTDGGETSGWLNAGDAFHGVSVASFDRKTEVLTVEKDGKAFQLHLRDSKVKDGKMTIEGHITLGNSQKDDPVRASLFLGEESVYPMKDGVMLHLTVHRLADGTLSSSASAMGTWDFHSSPEGCLP
jgi:hypothetical protein